MIRLLNVLVVAFVCVVPLRAPASDDPLAGLDAAIESAREQWHAPGLAVAIVKDDKVVYQRGFGTKQLGRNDPVDPHTLFTLASTTKAFTAMALGLLVDDGKLHWDDPVVKYLPEFRVADPYVTREVTIRDLLVHRTGTEELDMLWVRGFDTRTSLEHMQYAKQASSLRSTWAYNNMMYVVAAEVVTRVAGMSFQEFVRRRLFEPLGMSDSLFTGPELGKHANVTGAHLIEQGVARATDLYVSPEPLGAAGIQSSAADMAKWLRLLLDKGAFEGKAVVKPETVAEALKPQMLLASIGYPAATQANPHFYAYGLGWFLQDYKGRLVAMHTGSLYGANALAAIVPEERLGLVILINAGPVEFRHAFMYDVIDRFLHSRGKDWNADMLKLYGGLQEEENKRRAEAMRARPAKTRPSLPLSDYVGTYADPLVGETQVALNRNGGLTLAMQPGATFVLTHWSFESFEAGDTRAPEERFLLTFRRGADGRISGFETATGRVYRRR
ncbi:MAG TPA: serine hydrolase [Steroidobacteraceae bacterium]|nr:serine hydrolase [Steroidobacteraceae bacterium]